MGYKPQRRIYKLVFADPEFDGLEVRARSLPLGSFMQIGSLVGLADKDEDDFGVEDIEEMGKAFRAFAKALVSWNVEEDDGTPVPATLDGLYSQDFGFVLKILMTWIQVVSNVGADLGKDSSFGGTSPAPPLPMEPLSPNPGN